MLRLRHACAIVYRTLHEAKAVHDQVIGCESLEASSYRWSIVTNTLSHTISKRYMYDGLQSEKKFILRAYSSSPQICYQVIYTFQIFDVRIPSRHSVAFLSNCYNECDLNPTTLQTDGHTIAISDVKRGQNLEAEANFWRLRPRPEIITKKHQIMINNIRFKIISEQINKIPEFYRFL